MDEYKNYLEFGFVLRLAGTIYDSKKALPFVIESIEHFHNHNALIQELHSRIELSVIHIYNEEFELAQEQLEITSKISQKNFIESYIITNNLAIVNLYQNKDIEKSTYFFKCNVILGNYNHSKQAHRIHIIFRFRVNITTPNRVTKNNNITHQKIRIVFNYLLC